MAGDVGNPNLASVLDDLGWSPGRTAKTINTFLGREQIARTTVWGWIHLGAVPGGHTPTVLTHLLAEATGRDITLNWLWQGRAKRSELFVPAYVGLDVPWHIGGIVSLVNEWLRYPGGDAVDRRVFLAVSGATLTMPAWEYIESLGGSAPVLAGIGRNGGQKVTHGMVDVIEKTIMALRRLDDQEGGSGENLRFVREHFAAVGDLLKRKDVTDSKVTTRLLSAWASLGHLAGWMAHDGEHHGLAQRYWKTALHAAQQAEDHALGAHLLATMGNHATESGSPRDAVELANAAMIAAERTPPAVRASVAGRFGRAQAAIGNESVLRTAVDDARGLIQESDAKPSWLYYYDPADLERQTCISLSILSMASTRRNSRLTDEIRGSFDRSVASIDTEFPRDGLWEVAWFARSMVHAGEVDVALSAGRRSLTGLRTMRSPRVVNKFRMLDTELAELPHSREVSRFRGELRHALAA